MLAKVPFASKNTLQEIRSFDPSPKGARVE